MATFERLLGVVRELPEPYRTTVLLRHYHGLAVREVASRLDLSEAAVRQQSKRGLDEVRRRLRERDGAAWRQRLEGIVPWAQRWSMSAPARPLPPRLSERSTALVRRAVVWT